MGESITTGDAVADKLLRYIVARVEAIRGQVGEDLRDGVMSISFPFRGLAFQNDLDVAQVVPALQLLHDQELLRVNLGNRQYGCQVWIRAKLRSAA